MITSADAATICSQIEKKILDGVLTKIDEFSNSIQRKCQISIEQAQQLTHQEFLSGFGELAESQITSLTKQNEQSVRLQNLLATTNNALENRLNSNEKQLASVISETKAFNKLLNNIEKVKDTDNK